MSDNWPPKGDYERWTPLSSFKPAWNDRTDILRVLIPNEARTILEFGAGTCYLKTLLAPHQVYTPSDLVSRGPGTIVKDLNETPYDFIDGQYDVIVLSGVFEYILPIVEFIPYLAAITETVICSYANTMYDVNFSISQGWVNFFRQKEFVQMFKEAGFAHIYTRSWKDQSLYIFGPQKVRE